MTTAHERHVKAKHIKMSFVVLTILFFLTLVGFAWLLNDVRNLSHKTAKLSKATAHLAVENSKRINEIQTSRVYSCKANYRAIPQVFVPFFPKTNLTPEQKRDLVKLHRVVGRLVKGCEKQTRPIK